MMSVDEVTNEKNEKMNIRSPKDRSQVIVAVVFAVITLLIILGSSFFGRAEMGESEDSSKISAGAQTTEAPDTGYRDWVINGIDDANDEPAWYD